MSKKIIITGASGGFGQLTVQGLLKAGHTVVGTMRGVEGRNKAAAATLTQAGAKVVEMDVTDDQSVEAGVTKAIELLGGLDVVINNAGVGSIGMLEHHTPEDFRKLFEVNVFGVQRVNRAALPHLRQQGSGTILFVSSLLGRVTLPFYGVYNATKWALEALAENYRIELSTFGIEVCLIEPGGYATAFGENLIPASDQSRNESYGEFMKMPEQMFGGFVEALNNNPNQKPEFVADAMVAVVNKPVGEKPFRTVIDTMGMGELVKQANDVQDNITSTMYGNFGIDGLLKVQPAAKTEG